MLKNRRMSIFLICWFAVFRVWLRCGVRFDMQDQPRYKAYKKSDFFNDKRASRDLPEGTVARGQLHDNKAFYTGKIDNPNLNAPVTTTTDATGNTLVSSFPNDIDEFPVPVTKELVDRGQERYNIYCIVCHGPVGNGDGMVVRRGFPQPPTYHDDRLRNAPVGHFFDVMTNGWGKMNSYALSDPAGGPLGDRRVYSGLQVSQNPELIKNENRAIQTRIQPRTPRVRTTRTEVQRKWRISINYQAPDEINTLRTLALGIGGIAPDRLGCRCVFQRRAGASFVAAWDLSFGAVSVSGQSGHSDAPVPDGRRLGRRDRRILEAGSRTLPVIILMFIPLAIGVYN